MKTAREVADLIWAMGSNNRYSVETVLRQWGEEIRESAAKVAEASGASNPYHAIGADLAARAIRSIEIK